MSPLVKQRPESAIAYVGAAAFLLSAAWYGLAVKGVTTTLRPAFAPDQDFDQRLGVYYRWFATTVRQERFYGSLRSSASCAWRRRCSSSASEHGPAT